MNSRRSGVKAQKRRGVRISDFIELRPDLRPRTLLRREESGSPERPLRIVPKPERDSSEER